MGRRPGVSIDKRNIALELLKGSARAYDVARRFDCNERTIYRLQQRVLYTGSFNDPPRSGRPRVATPREDMYMITSSHRHRFITATNISQCLRQATRTRISFYSDKNRLSAARLRPQRPYMYIGVPLTQRHRVARLDWLRQYNF